MSRSSQSSPPPHARPRCARAVVAAFLVALAGGCGDKALEVTLTPPADEATAGISYACVNHVLIRVSSTDGTDDACVAVPQRSIRSLTDHNLHGLLDIPMPVGLTGIEVLGKMSDDDCNGDTIFHGRGTYQGGATLRVKLTHALDCADFTNATETVQVLDLGRLIGNGPDRCSFSAPPNLLMLAPRHMYPIGDDAAPGADAARTAVDVSTSGLAQLAGPHFSAALPPSCLLASTAPGTAATTSTWDHSSSCLPPRTAADPRLCRTSTHEVIVAPAATVGEFYRMRTDPTKSTAVAFVWDAATGAPLAGATVAPVDDLPGVARNYFALLAGRFTPVAAGTATTSAGLFAIELKAPMDVTITAPGYRTRRAVLAANVTLGIQAIAMTRE
ncbi:MAG: carboxypeptidase-like regulatory domain-containing protein [Kofleriaceae bacterium]